MSSSVVACTYCVDNTAGVRVKCCNCEDFTLCLQCFAAGAEIGPHKNNHDYQFVDTGQSFFRDGNNWSAKEEMELLNGIEHYGFGNWDDVANLTYPHSAEDACKEYIARYVEGVIGKVWTESTNRSLKILDLTPDSKLTPTYLPVPLVESADPTSLGYMPMRGDFETEFDNEAEKKLKLLNVNKPDDDKLDVALKLADVDMYNSSLKERERRKRIVADYSLINQFFSYRRERFRTIHPPPGELEVSQKLRWLCQLRSAKEHGCLVKNIQRQRDLRLRLKELIKYRENGITKLNELPHFERDFASKKRFFYRRQSDGIVERKKRKKRRVIFYRKKIHAPHRQPHIIARARAAALAAAAAAQAANAPDEDEDDYSSTAS